MNTSTQSKTSYATAVLKIGFFAGSLDILSAFVSYYLATRTNPLKVLNYVASGAFGKTAAYGGGAGMALLGLLFHYLIAFAFTLFFFWVYPRIKLAVVNKFLLALIYGLFTWLVMNKLVVPLSNIVPPASFNWGNAIKNMVILIFMVGLPISLGAEKYYSKRIEREG